jgi:UDP-glucose 4-epimerase
MTRVMITGATTPIGGAFVRKLAFDDAVERVLALGLEADPGPELLELPKVVYRQIDLTRGRSLRDLLFSDVKRLGIEAVVHAAHHRKATDEGERVHRLNVGVTRELMQLCERHPTVRRFVLRSHGAVYQVKADQPAVISEDHPLNLAPDAPQWIRDRVEADLTVCSQMGMCPMKIAVLRCAEVLAPRSGSQLFDYVSSRLCMRPLGYDPMINLLSLEDQVEALYRALTTEAAQGVFNIPGRDTLPLSELIHMMGRPDLPLPGALLSPLYRLRSRVERREFRYDMNHWRFHFSGVLDGRRARAELGYEASHPLRPAELAEHWQTGPDTIDLMRAR